jgi:hypothetical protein
VLFVQETMVCVTKARELFAKLLPNWFFCGTDSVGLSGGLLSSWNPRKANLNAFLTSAGILLEGYVKDLDRCMKLINCYGSYSDREAFWEAIKDEGILKEPNLVLGGDLNFTRSCREVWGEHARADPLHSFFSQLTQVEGVVDVEPIKLIPTWRNGRGGHDFIAKRLDRFLISEDLTQVGLRYKSKVCNIKISDHMPVVLYLEPESRKVRYPFKFNSIWLEDPDFDFMIRF